MKIVLASTSPLKIEACRKAFAKQADLDLLPLAVDSEIPQQPLDEETRKGALNRIRNAKTCFPNADVYVSMENGLFQETQNWFDRAVIAVAVKDETPVFVESKSVEFPYYCVEEARKRGFYSCTVGKVMEEQGLVNHYNDPHLDLCGISRVDLLSAALTRALSSAGII